MLASPAAASQEAGFAVDLALQSNQMFRGETISQDDPGAMAAISLDLPGGVYAGADVAAAAGGRPLRMTMNSQYAGVATRSGRTSIEIGVIHRHYRDNSDTDYRNDYFEGYVGLKRGKTRLRFYASPDYFFDGRMSYYAELQTRLATVGKWSVDGHVGLTAVPQDAGSTKSFPRIYEDWSLSAGREVKGFGLSVGVASTNYPVVGPSGKLRFHATLSRAF
jgi:uncharacterized protein (TIGR02001 family)